MTTQCTTYEIKGPFDARSVMVLEKDFEALIEQDKGEIILDLSEVDFLDSSGIGKIVFLYKRLLMQKRTLKITGLNGQPAKIIKALRIDKTITTVLMEEAA